MNDSPVPQGKYCPAVREGNLIFTAGMTPRVNGVLMLSGPIDPALPPETYKEAVRQSARNALTAARNTLAEGERISRVLSVTVYLSFSGPCEKHSKYADLASEYLCEELGEAGIAGRTSVAVASLPGNAPVEISLIAAVR